MDWSQLHSPIEQCVELVVGGGGVLLDGKKVFLLFCPPPFLQ